MGFWRRDGGRSPRLVASHGRALPRKVHDISRPHSQKRFIGQLCETSFVPSAWITTVVPSTENAIPPLNTCPAGMIYLAPFVHGAVKSIKWPQMGFSRSTAIHAAKVQ